MNKYSYNACDYRCERCLETEQCAVFRNPSGRDARNFALGRETDGIEAALWDGEDIIVATEEMLLEKAEEFDIDLDELTDAGPRGIHNYAFCSRSFSCTHMLTSVSADTPRRWASSCTSSDS
jgi:hypothetical protein